MANHHATKQEIEVLFALTGAKELDVTEFRDSDQFALAYEYPNSEIVLSPNLDTARRDLCSTINAQKDRA